MIIVTTKATDIATITEIFSGISTHRGHSHTVIYNHRYRFRYIHMCYAF